MYFQQIKKMSSDRDYEKMDTRMKFVLEEENYISQHPVQQGTLSGSCLPGVYREVSLWNNMGLSVLFIVLG